MNHKGNGGLAIKIVAYKMNVNFIELKLYLDS